MHWKIGAEVSSRKPEGSEQNFLVIWQFTSLNANDTQLFSHSSVSLSHADLFPGCWRFSSTLSLLISTKSSNKLPLLQVKDSWKLQGPASSELSESPCLFPGCWRFSPYWSFRSTSSFQPLLLGCWCLYIRYLLPGCCLLENSFK